MDAEHRHELKQNDFVVYAKKTPEYIKSHWWESICVVVIIVALVLHFRDDTEVRPKMDKQAEVTSLYQDISTAKAEAIGGEASIDAVESLIDELLEKSSSLKGAQSSLAKIKAADAIRSQLHYSDSMPTAEQIEAHTVEAITLYEQAVKEAEGNLTVEAFGKYGIALAHQDAGKFEEAANLYGQIIANADYDKTCVVEMAKDKLDSIATAKQTFTFVEPPAQPAVESSDEVEVQENAVN
jgi:tetratricopeptide (TPR) repeat protein